LWKQPEGWVFCGSAVLMMNDNPVVVQAVKLVLVLLWSKYRTVLIVRRKAVAWLQQFEVLVECGVSKRAVRFLVMGPEQWRMLCLGAAVAASASRRVYQLSSVQGAPVLCVWRSM
jgi:hypothetical protein